MTNNTVIIYLSFEIGNVTDIDIKLERAEGDTAFQGRVLVGLNGAWGAICPYGWDLNDAHVVCKQLGFARAVRATKNSEYGLWTGRIWLSNLQCNGSEESLINCEHDGWGISSSYFDYYHHCNCSEMASIICTGR